MNSKRMHPLRILRSLFSLIKNSAIIIIYLFVIRMNDTSSFLKVGRIIFLIFMIYQMIAIVVDWWKTSYEIKNNSIHMYRGLFKKRHNRIPLSSVQNIQRSTPFYFKFFGVTSLNLETSSTDKRASVTFNAITDDEATRIEQELNQVKYYSEKMIDKSDKLSNHENDIEDDEMKSLETQIAKEVDKKNDFSYADRIIHFQPTRKELMKASFLSLSFLVVIPVLITMYENVEDFISIEDKALNFFRVITETWILIGIAIVILAVILVGIGVLWTFLKYGKYEISSDQDHIYIRMGVLSEQSLSIRKRNVQAIELIQTPIKKWLGLCEIKLVSAESVNEEGPKISSLYPYMEKDRSLHIIQELLPRFLIQKEMNRLPKASLMMKMIRIPWFFIIALLFIVIFQKTWWYVLPFLLMITYVLRYFSYRNTRYVIEDGNIQFKTGGLWSSWFVTNRNNVIEIEVKRSFWQQKLGLATILTVNQTKPVHHEELMDIPIEKSQHFIHWYGNRYDEITEVETKS